MVSNFNSSEDILFFLWFSVCRYLAGFIEKMKRMKAFVNELMRDASDATRRQKVIIGITRSDSILFQCSFSFRERWNGAFQRAWKKQKNENNTFIIVVKTKKTTKKTTKKKLMCNGRTLSA